MWVSFFLYFAIALQFPLAWGRVFAPIPYWNEFQLLANGSAGGLALVFLLLDFERTLAFFRRCSGINRWPFWVLGLIAFTSLLHANGGFESMMLGPARLLLLLLAAVYAREFMRTLPLALFGVGVVSAMISIREVASGQISYGLSGNWNWSNTLMLIGLPALGVILRRRIGFFIGGGAALLLVALGGMHFSVAALLCAAGALFLLLLLARRKGWLSPICLIAAVVLFGLLILAIRGMHFDVRPILWTASIRLGLDHFLAGVGPAGVGSALGGYIAPDYYLLPFAAAHHPHPHNEVLFFWNAWGIAGLALALTGALALYSSLRLFCRRPHYIPGYILFVALTIAGHGMLDVTASAWPLGPILWLSLGILWGGTISVRRVKMFPRNKVAIFAAAALLLVSTVMLAQSACSSYYFREALLHRQANRLEAWREALDKSIEARPTAWNLYAAARCALFDFQDPTSALDYLSRIQPETGVVNIDHNQGLRARILFLLGFPAEALHYAELEQKNFPLGVANMDFRNYLILRQRGEADWKIADHELAEILRVRKLRRTAIPYLQRHMELDVNGTDIPRKFRTEEAENP